MGKFFVNLINNFLFFFRQVAGVDLNCGCPKKDVRREGVGSKLLDNPELIMDIVKQTRARISDPTFTVSTKIRIKYPLEQTVDMCKKVALGFWCNVKHLFSVGSHWC
jgi:tRNA-dihydrouridine synthase